MPGLADIKTGSVPGPRAFGADREYPSPDGRWLLRLSKPGEIRMGVGVWHSIDMTDLADGAEARTLLPERSMSSLMFECYAPWNASSEKVAASTVRWTGTSLLPGYVIYDLTTGHVRVTEADGFVALAMAWSPAADLLLLATVDRCRLVDGTGVVVSEVNDTNRSLGAVLAGWAPSGSTFFRLEGSGHATVVAFYEPTTGTVVERVPFDPSAVVPYDASAYRELDRDSYSLVINDGLGAAGRLLDNWNDPRYDPATATLHVSVLRPVSPLQDITMPGGRTVRGCRVRTEWVAATVLD